MTDINYKITFFSEWHAGSGLTSGSDLDALVIKSKDGLPFIPGKTLKGLLKEAAYEITRFNAGMQTDFINIIFGDANDLSKSTIGLCHFTNAELDIFLQCEISKEQLAPLFYREISSTSILEGGTAKPHSLRKMEVTIPCVLFARILNVPDGLEHGIKDCFQWVKRLGQNRHRGLGRCKFEFISEGGMI